MMTEGIHKHEQRLAQQTYSISGGEFEQFIADQFAISPVLAPSIGYRVLTVTYPDVRNPSLIAVLHGDGSPTEHYDLTARK